MKYIIGSRGSRLALIQTKYVQEKLAKAYPEHSFEIEVIKTKGDKIQNKPLDKIGGKGLFVKEIEEKIISGEIHMGVHSMKDMPSTPAKGLVFTKSWKREDPRDVLILRTASNLSDLRKGAVIGTGSKRRAFQLLKQRPDLKIVNIRGNVDTRLRKMEEQELDGIILAAAGLKRLGLEKRISRYFDTEEILPAAGQGILAVQGKKGLDYEYLKGYDDPEAHSVALAERAFVRYLNGGCTSPVAAYGQIQEGQLKLCGLYYEEETGHYLKGSKTGAVSEAEALGIALAKELKERCRKEYKVAKQEERKEMGKVWLVGAGPGDAGLFTLKGADVLEKADVVVYDSLVGQGILTRIPPDARLINVGKRA